MQCWCSASMSNIRNVGVSDYLRYGDQETASDMREKNHNHPKTKNGNVCGFSREIL